MRKSYSIETISAGMNPNSIRLELLDIDYKNNLSENKEVSTFINVITGMGMSRNGPGIINIEITPEQNHDLKPFVGMILDMDLKANGGI